MRSKRLARLLSNCAAAALLLLTGVAGEAAVSWRYVETVDGVRTASTYAQGRTPAGQVSMRLEVRCLRRPALKRANGWAVLVPAYEPRSRTARRS